jgi:hypothetical protein
MCLSTTAHWSAVQTRDEIRAPDPDYVLAPDPDYVLDLAAVLVREV